MLCCATERQTSTGAQRQSGRELVFHIYAVFIAFWKKNTSSDVAVTSTSSRLTRVFVEQDLYHEATSQFSRKGNPRLLVYFYYSSPSEKNKIARKSQKHGVQLLPLVPRRVRRQWQRMWRSCRIAEWSARSSFLCRSSSRCKCSRSGRPPPDRREKSWPRLEPTGSLWPAHWRSWVWIVINNRMSSCETGKCLISEPQAMSDGWDWIWSLHSSKPATVGVQHCTTAKHQAAGFSGTLAIVHRLSSRH